MANRLELPEDLQKLIEKRGEADRRQVTPEDQGASPNEAPTPEASDRRSGADRRAEE